jgi:N-acetylglucosaminyldiphosphoundecaprenol N-acetyl-beta-D-mannosaminyltransferase
MHEDTKHIKSKLVEKIILTDSKNEDTFLGQKGRIYSFLNPVSYLDALKHQNLFCQMDGLFADGSLLVAAIKLCYGVKVKRYSFDMTSLASTLLSYAVRNGKSVYIVASKQEQVERAVEIIREQYKDISIVGYRNGYFTNEAEKTEEAKHIVELNPDFVIVGMGAITQEQFLLKVKKAGYLGIGFTCGGFIHQTSREIIDYYPAWIDRMNIRFLYRMWKEPHTRKRYMIAGIVFPIRFIRERIF